MPTVRPSARLRDASEPTWSELAAHPFLAELAAAELAPERFRFYVEQNLLYLPQYARVMALGAAKSRDQRELELFSGALRQVIEVELPENRALRERVVELGAADRGGALEPAPANLAYTSWLLSVGFTGGATEILAAVLPCTWSYGAIARRLAATAAEHPVYRPWISFFAGEEYSAVVQRMRSEVDELARGARLEPLEGIFRTGVRLERGFWDMAYEMPAVAPGTSAT
ncbi:MAG: thiaminase II [Solirubrobacteraceae bacterium]